MKPPLVAFLLALCLIIVIPPSPSAQQKESYAPEELYPFQPLIIVLSPDFSPEAIKVMKEFWGKAGAAVRVAFDERDERIREKLIRYGIYGDFTISEIIPLVCYFDAFIFMGKLPKERRRDELYWSVLERAFDMERTIGAVGCAVALLAEHGFLKDEATGCPEIAPYLEDMGIRYTGEGVTWSGAFGTCKEEKEALIEFAYHIAFDYQIRQLPTPEWMKRAERLLRRLK